LTYRFGLLGSMKDFTKGSILQQLVQFTVPLLLANLLQALYNVMDGIWVGRLLGHQALAAVSVSGPLIFLLVSAAIGLAIATTILAGQAWGSRNTRYLARLLSNSFLATMVLCVVIVAAGVAFARPLLRLVNTPAEVEHDAHTFFVIMMVGVVFNFGFNWFSGILRGLGDARTPFLLLLGSTALNVALVPVLVVGLGPFPRLGVAGAAIGTVVANIVALVVGYWAVLRRHPVVGIRAWDFTVDWDIIKRLVFIGVPASLQMIVTSVAGVLVMSLVNTFGTQVTAAYGIGMQVDSLSFLPGMAIGMSVSSMVAQNLGAGRHDRVRKIVGLSLLLATATAAACFLVVMLIPHAVASVFNKDPAVIRYTQEYLRIAAFSYFTFAWMFALQGVVRGAGDTLVMLLITFAAVVLVRYPAAVVLAR
jgi:putative MATE family efflux protein